jgi:DNA-binding NtrC family response regulator
MSNGQQPILLVVTDDNLVLRQITKMTSEIVQVIASRRSTHASVVFDRAERVDAVIVGRVADAVSPIDVLKEARTKRPQARTIMLADPADLSSSIEALHAGVVDHVLNPPLREPELVQILKMPPPRVIVQATPNMHSAKRSI